MLLYQPKACKLSARREKAWERFFTTVSQNYLIGWTDCLNCQRWNSFKFLLIFFQVSRSYSVWILLNSNHPCSVVVCCDLVGVFLSWWTLILMYSCLCTALSYFFFPKRSRGRRRTKTIAGKLLVYWGPAHRHDNVYLVCKQLSSVVCDGGLHSAAPKWTNGQTKRHWIL